MSLLLVATEKILAFGAACGIRRVDLVAPPKSATNGPKESRQRRAQSQHLSCRRRQVTWLRLTNFPAASSRVS